MMVRRPSGPSLDAMAGQQRRAVSATSAAAAATSATDGTTSHSTTTSSIFSDAPLMMNDDSNDNNNNNNVGTTTVTTPTASIGTGIGASIDASQVTVRPMYNKTSNTDNNQNQQAEGERLEAQSRDSRSSSSTNSPAPPDQEESDFYPVGNDSESSLGVVPGNLQDMQVNEDYDCPSIASTLPSEILISIFSRLSNPADLFKCMTVSRRWARNAVEMLWHRPSCTTWEKHTKICQTLGMEQPTFVYPEFIRRLNLAALAAQVSDGSLMPLAVCSRVERMTLTGCMDLTDVGLMALVRNNHNLMSLDVSGDRKITEKSIYAIAENCPRLQGLNVSMCSAISNESLVRLARSCRYIKRLKLNDCVDLNDEAVLAFANNCPNMLEIDLHGCKNIGNAPVTALLSNGQCLRELRLANCELVDDDAFLALPHNRMYDHLRILDLTCCVNLTDRAVEKIIDTAPRLRNLVLAKCGQLTDAAVYSITRLGRNLHYVHLGHCRNITDDAVKQLAHDCQRIRYIDLGCCSHLTDESVEKLAQLPKLKRVGLVKCSAITNKSIDALAKGPNQRNKPRRDNAGNVVVGGEYHQSSLERVHLSYCISLTLPCIIHLLNSCRKLTHLSLTGVPAFLRDDLNGYCREAPRDFTEHQRQVFCVFSGSGVGGLRNYLNSRPEFAEFQDVRPHGRAQLNAAGNNAGGGGGGGGGGGNTVNGGGENGNGNENGMVADPDAAFDDADIAEDDDMGEGSEIAADMGNEDGVIVVQAHHPHHDNSDLNDNNINNQIPPPPPPPPTSAWLENPNHTGPGVVAGAPTASPAALALDTTNVPVALESFLASPDAATPTQTSLEMTMAARATTAEPGEGVPVALVNGLDSIPESGAEMAMDVGASTATMHVQGQGMDGQVQSG